MKKLIIIIFSLLFCFILAGCGAVKELERTDFANIEKRIEYRDRYHLDSVFVRDSVIIHVKGDTVFKDRWRDRWRDRIIRDTINISHTDTVYIEKEVFRERTEPPDSNWKEIILLIIIVILIFKFK